MADIPTAEDPNLQKYPSSQLEVDGLGLMEDFNSTWTGSSDCSPPSDHDLLYLKHSPPCTPELAPEHNDYPIVSQYHVDRAHWHENAAKFHRQQAAYLLEQSSELFDVTIPPEQPSPNSSCDTMSSHGDLHSRSSRISRHGAIQKSQPALPAHISRALLSQQGLQQFARVSDPSEIPTRTLTRLKFEPRSVYTEIKSCPAAWGPNDRFTYNEYAELAPGDRFTVEEMNIFLHRNPRELTLFIQRNPSDSRSRYGHPAASRCRFLDCLAGHYLIGQGHVRVCFSENELSSRGQNLDPFHNAGYVHLYCLERFLDFPMLCSKLNVRVEDRIFPLEPRGKNRMLLSSRLERKEVTDFITRCKNNQLSRKYPRCGTPNWTFQGTLCNRICIRKVEAEPPKVKQARKERGDKKSTIGQHLGNLEMETKYRQRSRKNQRYQQDNCNNSVSSEDGEGHEESDSGDFSGVQKSQKPHTDEFEPREMSTAQPSLYAGSPTPHRPVSADSPTPPTAQATEQPLIGTLGSHDANHGHEEDLNDHNGDDDDETRKLFEE